MNGILIVLLLYDIIKPPPPLLNSHRTDTVQTPTVDTDANSNSNFKHLRCGVDPMNIRQPRTQQPFQLEFRFLLTGLLGMPLKRTLTALRTEKTELLPSSAC